MSLDIFPLYVTQSTIPYSDNTLAHDTSKLGFNPRLVTFLLVDGALDVLLCYELLHMT